MSAAKKSKAVAPLAWLDRGAVTGALAASLVGVAWGFVTLSSADPKEGTVRPNTPTTVPNQEQETQVSDPAPAPQVEPAYKQGMRDAIKLGKEGLQDFEKALKWKEDIGGDPFKFANMVKEASAKVNRAILALESLRKDAKSDLRATEQIDEWVEYFRSKVPSNRK